MRQHFRKHIRRPALYATLLVPVVLTTAICLEVKAYKRSVDWVMHTKRVMQELNSLLLHVTQAENAERGHIITNDAMFMVRCRQSCAEAVGNLSQIRTLTIDNPIQQKTMSYLERIVLHRLMRMDEEQRTMTLSPRSPEQGKVFLESDERLSQEIITTTQKMNTEEISLLELRRDKMRRTQIFVGFTFGLCVLVNFMLLVWAYDLKTQGIIRVDATTIKT